MHLSLQGRRRAGVLGKLPAEPRHRDHPPERSEGSGGEGTAKLAAADGETLSEGRAIRFYVSPAHRDGERAWLSSSPSRYVQKSLLAGLLRLQLSIACVHTCERPTEQEVWDNGQAARNAEGVWVRMCPRCPPELEEMGDTPEPSTAKAFPTSGREDPVASSWTWWKGLVASRDPKRLSYRVRLTLVLCHGQLVTVALLCLGSHPSETLLRAAGMGDPHM